ncbi:uncharacterized protein MONOS_17458 [Monocercomonoides exilis]|uniref:uncharacterized protein n=1 Tax=Monocercomonoides exilis TaxID=2049356 RepID=UPI003559F0F5|nr:hypothetical protein MONOS_17458 [Monocercomonoides exilis]
MRSSTCKRIDNGHVKKTFRKKFTKMLGELECCDKSKKKQIIEEMNELLGKMDKEEFESTFNEDLFDDVDSMIEEKNLSNGIAAMLLKEIGYQKNLRISSNASFKYSVLKLTLEEIITKEERKCKEKYGWLVVDICECYLLLRNDYHYLPEETVSVCVPCLLEVAMNKDRSEKTQKKVELALMALGNVGHLVKIERALYLKEITEIIKYHQEHRNLTHLAYQSAWNFLIDRLCNAKSLETLISKKLNFAREAIQELEEMSKRVDWRVEGKTEEDGKIKEVQIILKWIYTINAFFVFFKTWKEEYVELFHLLVEMCRSSRTFKQGITEKFIILFQITAHMDAVSVYALLKCGAYDQISEEIRLPTMEDEIAQKCLEGFSDLSKRMKGKMTNEVDEMKIKEIKREMFDRLEEEGHEDMITTDYFVNV